MIGIIVLIFLKSPFCRLMLIPIGQAFSRPEKLRGQKVMHRNQIFTRFATKLHHTR
jgi:hypothetical protein